MKFRCEKKNSTGTYFSEDKCQTCEIQLDLHVKILADNTSGDQHPPAPSPSLFQQSCAVICEKCDFDCTLVKTNMK